MGAALPSPVTIELHVPVSVGELIDKITILAIKLRQIDDPERLEHIRSEHTALEAVVRSADLRSLAGLEPLEQDLLAVNETLWRIEDDIRACERRRDFGAGFIALARSVYRTNDQRAELKRRINVLCGSRYVEEKSYNPY